MQIPIQDHTCGWTQHAEPAPPRAHLNGHLKADWLIIGGGYTGLSAARQLERHDPNARIVLIEGARIGQGASARNSGYLVDSTLNDGHLSDSGLTAYRSKLALNQAGIAAVERFADDCAEPLTLNRCGKYHGAANALNHRKLLQFGATLNECGLDFEHLGAAELAARLGTEYYHEAIYTPGAIMVQPAQLAFAMARALTTTQCYEHTPALKLDGHRDYVECTTAEGSIRAQRVLLCTNGYLRSAGHRRSFPLWLTASLTRPLRADELAAIGHPKPWGLLSAQAMGATVRLTEDYRLMIRNTVAVNGQLAADNDAMARARAHHLTGLQRRFGGLGLDDIEHTWGGVTGISGNSANVFEQADARIWRAGCYNGGGIGLATLFGEAVVDLARDQLTPAVMMIRQRPTPSWLPPEPALSVGVRARLWRDARRAKFER
ncbi:NAD(P)/FAD-dependent oxidoreductase [Litorivicinus lipolyticus]|uniref:NAD(P)/FAD-dependent oxidoreductase n=1 Tax=Litorivicinus lipolyticus TaxID=418701 RepID=UPI003B5AF8AD